MKRLFKKLTAAVLAAAMMTCAVPVSFGGMRLSEPAVTASAAENADGEKQDLEALRQQIIGKTLVSRITDRYTRKEEDEVSYQLGIKVRTLSNGVQKINALVYDLSFSRFEDVRSSPGIETALFTEIDWDFFDALGYSECGVTERMYTRYYRLDFPIPEEHKNETPLGLSVYDIKFRDDGSADVYLQLAYSDSSGTCGEKLTWSFDPETATLTIAGSGKMDDYDVSVKYWKSSDANPGEWDGEKWVGPYEFENHSSSAPWSQKRIQNLILPDGLTSIGEGAFFTYAPTCVEIPASVTEIGSLAFYHEKKMDELFVWKEGLRCIKGHKGTAAEEYAKKNGILFEDLDEDVHPFGESLMWRFDEASGTLTIMGQGSMPEMATADLPWNYMSDQVNYVVVEDGVTSICSDAFWMCRNLTSVSIPGSVTSIGYRAFLGCGALESIYIPPSVTSISYGVFADPLIGYDHLPENLSLQGRSGSYAEEYAREHDIKFEALTLWGDVNCDSSVDIADAVLICRFAVADAEAEITDQGRKQADVNHDGTVDAKDSEKLVQYIAKKLTADDLKA